MKVTNQNVTLLSGLLVAGTLACVGVGQAWAEKKPAAGTTMSAIVKSVDAARMTIVVLVSPGNKQPAVEKTFDLAKDVAVVLPGTTKDPVPGKLADVRAEARVALTVDSDNKITRIVLEAAIASGTIKKVQDGKITIAAAGKGKNQPTGTEETYALGEGVKITLPGGDKTNPAPEGKLSDLAEGTTVSLKLSVDKKTVLGIAVLPAGAKPNGNKPK
jgi:hypothetical protein